MRLTSSRRGALLLASLAVLTAPAVGCGSPQSTVQAQNQATASSSSAPNPADEARLRECNELVAVINRGAENIERIGDGGAEMSKQDLLTMASTLERAAIESSSVALTLPGLQQRAAQYKEMSGRAAAAARSLAAAIDSNVPAQVEAAGIVLQTAVEPEDRIIESINAFCKIP